MQNTARLLAALLSLIAGPALAQCPANFPANSVGGRLAIPAAGGPCQAIPFQQFANSLFSASTVTLPTLRVIATNPTLSTVDYGFATSNKAVAFSTTVTGTGSGVGSGGIAQYRISSTATDVQGTAAWEGQTRVEAPVENYGMLGIVDVQSTGAFGAALGAILRNGVAPVPAYDDSPGSITGMNGVIAFSEMDAGPGHNAFVATNSITATNRWHVGLKTINVSDAVIRADQFASTAVLDFRRLNGDNSAPLALASGDHIFDINAYGWGTAMSSAPRAGISARASQIWTASNQGTSVFVRATRSNTTTTNDVVRLNGDIPLSVLQIVGDNQGQSLRLVPQYDITKYWDIWTNTSGGINIKNDAGVGLGIDPSGAIFPGGIIDLAAGRILFTNIAAPSSPASGRASVYVDSTSLALVSKDANGTVHTTVTPDAGASNNFLTAVGTNGAISKAQPAFTNISGFATAAQGGFGSDVSASSGVPLFAAGVPTFTSTSGSGNFVRVTSPTMVTPVLGAATATSINGLTLTSSTGVFTLTNAKTLSVSNTLTFTGTDSSSVAFGAGGTVAYTGGTLAQFAATTSAQLLGVLSDETGTGKAVFNIAPAITGEMVVTAATSGTVNTFTIAAGGNTASDVPAFRITSLAGTVVYNQFGDASAGNFRNKALGSVSFHAGDVAVSATNEWFKITTTGQLQGQPATTITAGGSSATSLTFSSTFIGIFVGSGAPTLSAAKGSLYLRTDGSGIADRIYVNTNGSTTWTNLVSGAWLFERDLNPANDNVPAFMNKVA